MMKGQFDCWGERSSPSHAQTRAERSQTKKHRLREKPLSAVIKTMSHILMCFAPALLMILSGSLQAREGGQQHTMPLPVRMVLHKVSPMLENEDYGKAATTLKQFLDNGGPVETAMSGEDATYHHPEVYFVLGNCYLMQEKFALATSAYEYSVQGRPDFTSAWLNLGRAVYELGQLSRAGECFLRAYETAKGKKPEHLYHSVLSYLMAEDYSQAITKLKRLFQVHPSAVKPEWKENMVHALLAVNKPRAALPYIQDLARNTSGKRQRTWEEILLYHYLELDMPSKALGLGKELTQQHPTVSTWWKALSHINLNLGHNEEALAALMVYGYLRPLSDEEKKLVADLYLEAAIPVKAIPLYSSWLQDNSDPQVLRRLVLAYRRLGKPEKALEAIETMGPQAKNSDLLMLEGELLYELEDFDQAARIFEQAAVKKGSHRGRAWIMAGYAAWQNKDYSFSQKAFHQAVQYEGQKKEARRALHQIQKLVFREKM